MTYRLIDTTGIGDTRGLDFDKQNMIDILATVNGYDYLHAAKNGVIIDNKKDFDSSWERSSDEAHRMLKYFGTKRPHAVKNTTILNGTRNLIKELTKPMAEISACLRPNMTLIEDDIKEVQDKYLYGDELRTRLHPEKNVLKKFNLEIHRTVCSDQSCVEYKDDGTGSDNMLTDYANPCHPIYYLDGVPIDTMAPLGLMGCWAFSGHEDCQQCEHHWSVHLHVMYELEVYRTTIKDIGIEQQLRDHARDLELKQAAIHKRELLVDECRQEHEAIQLAAAKFKVFMKENSILPYNNATIKYLDMMIEVKQAKIDAGGGVDHHKALNSRREDKQKHIELVDILENSMRAGAASHAIDQNEVNRTISLLCDLKHFGKSLEELQVQISYTQALTNRENRIA